MKNKYLAAFLSFFLGALGAHKFYLGDKKKGYVYIAFSWTGIPAFLGIFESVKILKLSENDFQAYHEDYLKYYENFNKELEKSEEDQKRPTNHIKRSPQEEITVENSKSIKKSQENEEIFNKKIEFKNIESLAIIMSDSFFGFGKNGKRIFKISKPAREKAFRGQYPLGQFILKNEKKQWRKIEDIYFSMFKNDQFLKTLDKINKNSDLDHDWIYEKIELANKYTKSNNINLESKIKEAKERITTAKSKAKKEEEDKSGINIKMKCYICDEECQKLYDTLLSKPPPPWSHVIVHPKRGEIDRGRNFVGEELFNPEFTGRFAVFKQYKILKRNVISSGVTEYVRGEKAQVVGKKLYDICHHCTWYSSNQKFVTDEKLYLNLTTKAKKYWNIDLNRLKANKKEWKKMVIKNVRRDIESILTEFDSVQSEIYSKLLKVKKLDYDSLLLLDSLGEIYSFIDDLKYSLPYRKKWIDFYISIGLLQGVEDRLHGEVFMLGEKFQIDLENNQNDKPQDPEPEIKDEQYFAKILELDYNYTFDDVKTSYKNKMKDYHPDKVASLADEFRELAEEKSKILNEAYDFFKNKFKTK